MTLHPRSDWTTVPAADANPIDPGDVLGVAVHWNGPAVPASALTDPRAFLEGVRRYHVATNGWSDIAYNRAADQTGERWNLRGLRHKSAANGTAELNSRWIAVFAIIGHGQAPTAELMAALVEEITAVRQVYPDATRITGHGLIDPTSVPCPGPHLTDAVTGGLLIPGDDMALSDDDLDKVARRTVSLLLGERAGGLRNQVRLALDEELGDESGVGAFSARVAAAVATTLPPAAAPVDVDALAGAVMARIQAWDRRP